LRLSSKNLEFSLQLEYFVIDSVIAQVEDRDLGEDQVLATRSGIGGL
jgi:hypothetical protein